MWQGSNQDVTSRIKTVKCILSATSHLAWWHIACFLFWDC